MKCMKVSAALLTICCGVSVSARQVGDPGVTFNQANINANKSDSSRNYWMMNNWKTAGKIGGIPWYSSNAAKITIKASQASQLQAQIDAVYRKGGGVLLCKAGTYYIHNKIQMKKGVILRGEGATRTIFKFDHRSTTGVAAFNAGSVDNVGFENLGIEYIAPGGKKPLPYTMANNPYNMKNLYVQMISFGGNAKNGWVQNCAIKNAGKDTMVLGYSSSHITVRNTSADGAFNKGAEGNGYWKFFGQYGLIYKNRAVRLRHVSMQGASKYNVMYRNNFQQDISFHTDDNGYNLVEGNNVNLTSGLISANPDFHAFLTVWSVKHKPVGPRNYVYHNNFKRNGVRDTFVKNGKESPLWYGTVYRPYDVQRKCYDNEKAPIGNTFYPVTNVTL